MPQDKEKQDLNLNCKSVQKRIAIMKESEEEKTTRIETAVGRKAVEVFAQVLQHEIMDMVDYPKNYHEKNDTDLVISLTEIEEILQRLLPKEEKEAI